jgi:lysophospholipase L1-like esterase
MTRFAALILAFMVSAFPVFAETVPNPLVSRGADVAVSHNPDRAYFLTDEIYSGQVWDSGGNLPCWASVRIPVNCSRLMAYLKVKGTGAYDEPANALVEYELQVSSDTTNGIGGTWSTVVSVRSNDKTSRVHSFPADGQKWVRLTITKWRMEADRGGLETIDLHDASSGTEDTYFFLGDSIYSMAFGHRGPNEQPDFSTCIHRTNEARWPVMVSGAHGGKLAVWGAENIDSFLREEPDLKYWCINFGMNDSWGDQIGDAERADAFKARMETIVKTVLAAGRVPILAPISYAMGDSHAGIPVYNARIRSLIRKYRLPAGPDLYKWFEEHPGELGQDGVHPNAKGCRSINRLWADAVLSAERAKAKGEKGKR